MTAFSRRRFNAALLAAAFMPPLAGRARAQSANVRTPLGPGELIGPGPFIEDADGKRHGLQSLLADGDAAVNLLFLFGGGDMGARMPGRLWCQDSFEDTHILRVLAARYQGRPVRFIPVANPPVYHSQFLGHPRGVFMNAAPASEEFAAARRAFVESTLAARELGILPVDPWFDTGFRLMMNRSEGALPGEAYGKVDPWQGMFRAADESQFYGVPSFWFLDGEGRVLAEPLRGNIYHPHGGGETQIRYTLADADRRLASLLAG